IEVVRTGRGVYLEVDSRTFVVADVCGEALDGRVALVGGGQVPLALRGTRQRVLAHDGIGHKWVTRRCLDGGDASVSIHGQCGASDQDQPAYSHQRGVDFRPKAQCRQNHRLNALSNKWWRLATTCTALQHSGSAVEGQLIGY